MKPTDQLDPPSNGGNSAIDEHTACSSCGCGLNVSKPPTDHTYKWDLKGENGTTRHYFCSWSCLMRWIPHVGLVHMERIMARNLPKPVETYEERKQKWRKGRI